MGITSKWRDSRIEYINILPGKINKVEEDFGDSIWSPDYAFYLTTKAREDVSFKTLEVMPMGNGTQSPSYDLFKRIYFNWDDVLIITRQFYVAEIQCKFKNLHLYPFDEDTCTFFIYVDGISSWTPFSNATLLDLDQVKPTVPQNIGQNVVVSRKTYITDLGYLAVDINFRRKFIGAFIQSALPVTLFSVIVYVTNTFCLEMFDIAVTVNVVCILAISGVYSNITNSLPPTASIKILEFHVLKCLSLSVFVCLMQTIHKMIWNRGAIVSPTERIKSKAEIRRIDKAAKVVYFVSSWIIPITSVLLDLVFIAFGIVHEYQLI